MKGAKARLENVSCFDDNGTTEPNIMNALIEYCSLFSNRARPVAKKFSNRGMILKDVLELSFTNC